VKIVQIAGFLGSGKTTALIKLAKELSEEGRKTAIVVNDIGDVAVDGKFLEDYGLKAKEIANGCICCQVSGSFAETISLLHRSFDPEILIVEPTGVASPEAIKRVAEYAEADSSLRIRHAPVVTLVDSTRIDLLLKAVRNLVERQIREADVIGINKIDAAKDDMIEKSEEFARSLNNKATILRISGKTGQGISEIVSIITK
jgi:G3E family GTPase